MLSAVKGRIVHIDLTHGPCHITLLASCWAEEPEVLLKVYFTALGFWMTSAIMLISLFYWVFIDLICFNSSSPLLPRFRDMESKFCDFSILCQSPPPPWLHSDMPKNPVEWPRKKLFWWKFHYVQPSLRRPGRLTTIIFCFNGAARYATMCTYVRAGALLGQGFNDLTVGELLDLVKHGDRVKTMLTAYPWPNCREAYVDRAGAVAIWLLVSCIENYFTNSEAFQQMKGPKSSPNVQEKWISLFAYHPANWPFDVPPCIVKIKIKFPFEHQFATYHARRQPCF